MILRSKSGIAILCFLSVVCIALITQLLSRRGTSATDWIPALKSPPSEPCPDNLDWVKSVNLTYPIRYARRDIITNQVSDLERASITKLDGPLFPDFQTLDLTREAQVQLQHCEKPLELNVSAVPQDPSDASHIIFGISTTIERIEESIPSLLRWLPHTKARLFVVVIESEQEGEGEEKKDAVAADPEKMTQVEAKMRGLGMKVTLIEPFGLQDMFSEKYFSLIRLMFDNRTDKTLWISLLDDDTFFPSMPRLLQMLAKYDPHKQYYVGGLSEDWWSVTHYGMMGFGGAGVFLSIALAEVMVDNYDLCIKSSYANAGDIRVMECIYILTETKLSNERELHQVDIHGDISGLYESGRMPLSLHHWKPGGADNKGYDLPVMNLVADVCGDCFLQRWQFGKKMVLSNGYSIAEYPKGNLKGLNMDEMEETWGPLPNVEGSINRGVDHSLAPIRPKLVLDEEKLQYRLVHAAAVDGGVRQLYLHPGVDGDIDSVYDLFWTQNKKTDAPSSQPTAR
ncbi:hypothetical protein ACLMJK_009216 [Lecanora helva]